MPRRASNYIINIINTNINTSATTTNSTVAILAQAVLHVSVRGPSVPGDAAAVTAAGTGYCAGTYSGESLGECGVPMNARFTMPANGNALWWYSFDFSAVKTIMLSSEHDLHPGSVQYKWLATQLSMVDREVTPWVVLELHRPMYNNENCEKLRTASDKTLHSVCLCQSATSCAAPYGKLSRERVFHRRGRLRHGHPDPVAA